ncbi:lysozyme [Streptomyces sp. NPDC050738]|uniref:lysozyme n=1 Tax=Streptomyces sp. NPDC050738 TaxID=3154744 RepID=UPI00342CA60C
MARDNTPFLQRARVRTLTVSVAALTVLGGTALAGLPASGADKPRGHDVSSHQKNVDWKKARAEGARFVYVKATESTTYRNPYFSQQYDGARKAGIIRGAYHFAVPAESPGNGKAQAAYFVTYGGWWHRDGWTMPPAVDLEHNPYGKDICYGLSKAQMVGWITSFSDEVRRRTGHRPVIYTTTRWWNSCTGKSRAFAPTHDLWLARYNTTPGELPAGWSYWTIWQYDNGSGSLPGDQNLFNGSVSRLQRFAKG